MLIIHFSSSTGHLKDNYEEKVKWSFGITMFYDSSYY